MNLFRTSALSIVATSIKMLSGFLINKLVAIYIGPSGLAIIGQFQNFTQIVLAISSGGFSSGITRFVAEANSKENKGENTLLVSTALKAAIATSFFTGFVLLVTGNYLAKKLFGNSEFSTCIYALGLTCTLNSINSIYLAFIHGHKDIKRYTILTIIQSLIALTLTSILIFFSGLYGALLALALNQTLVFCICVGNQSIRAWLKKSIFDRRFSAQKMRGLIKYTLMTLSSAILHPLSYIFIRNHISSKFGIYAAGKWQGVWFISTAYLTLITTSLSAYFLPRLSELSEKIEIRKELIDGYKLLLPITILTTTSVYFGRDIIISLLFSSNFHSMRDLFLPQLIGDLIRVCSLLPAHLMPSKGMYKTFVLSESIFAVSFYLLSILLTEKMGLTGVPWSYAANYSCYLIFVFFLYKKIK